MLNYHITRIFVHEIALHVDHNSDDFSMPFTKKVIGEPALKPGVVIETPRLDSIHDCIIASHDLINTFHACTLKELLSLPVFTFVRTVYACVVLIKISITALVPGSELGRVITDDDIKTEQYITRTLYQLMKASSGDMNTPAGKFAMILTTIQSWYRTRIDELVPGNAASVDSPMSSLKPTKIESPGVSAPR